MHRFAAMRTSRDNGVGEVVEKFDCAGERC